MIHHSNETLSRLSFTDGDVGEMAAAELRRRDHGLTGLVHPVGPTCFRACASCAVDEAACSCDRRDIQLYYGQPLGNGRVGSHLSRPMTLAQREQCQRRTGPSRPKGRPAEITVRTTGQGWIVEATSEETLPFRMGLRSVEAGGSHSVATVAALVKKIASTYPRGTKAPEVPAFAAAA